MNNEPSNNSNKGTFRWWFLTWNNPPENWKSVFDVFSSDYGIGQLEVGKDGTPHVQGCIYYHKAVRASKFKGIQCWIKGIDAGQASGVIKYCTKSETRSQDPHEYGKRPQSVSDKTDWEETLVAAKEGRFSAIPPRIFVCYYTNIKKIYAENATPFQAEDVRGLWIYGKPGAGKSHMVRQNYSSLYSKAQNKWFDGYMGELCILLDDFDESGQCLGHYLKIWADKWKCYGEIKGATTPLRHEVFAITSNFLPDTFWSGQMLEAINRRFVFIEVEDRVVKSTGMGSYSNFTRYVYN